MIKSHTSKNNTEHTQTNYYALAGTTVKIIHKDDVLAKNIIDEFKPYAAKPQKDVDWTITLGPNIREPLLPKKAVRLALRDDDESIYKYDNKSYICKDDLFFIVVDDVNKVLDINYSRYDLRIELRTRFFIKWIFINGAEAKGLTYIHGAAVQYHGKNIVITGEAGSGKSSSMLRFVSDGAKIISDDSVLFIGDKIFPFYMKTALSPDFSKRFNMMSGALKEDLYVDMKSDIRDIDLIIFPRMWNSDTSDVRKIDYKNALLNLMHIYKREVKFNPLFDWDRVDPQAHKKLFASYSALLENARCYEFYAGFDEKEVRKKILELADEN